jgi:polysaccharide biosynthesis protein PslH
LDGVKLHEVRGLAPVPVLRVFKKFVDVVRPTALYFFDFLFLLRVSILIRDADIVQIEQPSLGGLFNPIMQKLLRRRVVVDCHDVFQALRVKHTSFLRRLLETFLEKTAYKNANLLVTVSDAEKEYLKSFCFDDKTIIVVPNGVNTKVFQKSSTPSYVRKKYGLNGYFTVVFVGNLSYVANREAVQILSSVIAPKVSQQLGNVKFLVVGKLPRDLNLPGLSFTGFVDSVVEVLSVSDVAVAPLLQGSGTRLKILEYLSCGLPVVSTSTGAEGLKVENGVNIVLENDLDHFAIRVVELLQNEDLRKSMGLAGRELAKTTYDWERVVEKLEEGFASI